MAERSTFKEFVVAVIKRSVSDWSGHGGWFALAAYVSLLTLPLLVSGIIGKIAGDVAEKTTALLATGWLVLLLVFITPFRMWQEEKYKMDLVTESQQAKINVNWRFSNSIAELILMNISSKTITGIEVILRNYRNSDGTIINDVMSHLSSKDGKSAPMSLNPHVPTYFEFARLTTMRTGNRTIALLSENGNSFSIGEEAGVNIGVSGTDLPAFVIKLRIKITDSSSLSVESWEPGIPAVGHLTQ